MTGNGDDSKPWTDPDDAPELTDAWFRNAVRFDGGESVEEVATQVQAKRRVGRPKATRPKISTTLRLDADIVEHFRAGGPGWQTRLNDALRRAIDPSVG